MKVKVKFLPPLLVLALGGAIMFGVLNKRPTRLSIEVRAHPGAPSIVRLIANGGVILDGSFRGRSQTGGLSYQSSFGAELNLDATWFDLTTEDSFEKSFSIDTRLLSTFGERNTHASIKIVLGPGPDITVTTPEPEGLRLVGLNRMDEITPDMDIPVVLLELCGEPVAPNAQIVRVLKEALVDEGGLARAISKRDTWLEGNMSPLSQCMGEN